MDFAAPNTDTVVPDLHTARQVHVSVELEDLAVLENAVVHMDTVELAQTTA